MKTSVVILNLWAVLLAETLAAEWWTTMRADSNSISSLHSIFIGDTNLWKVASGQFKVEHDPALGADALTTLPGQPLALNGQTRYSGPNEIRARLRMRTDAAPNVSAHFYFGLTNAADSAFLVALSAVKGRDLITAAVHDHGQLLHDAAELAKTFDWTPQWSSSFGYYLKAYQKILPGWEEGYRAWIEDAMSRLPGLEEKWVDLCIQLRQGAVRAWLDDRLVATKESAALDPQGFLKIQLSPGVQLASFAVAPLVETGGFYPLALKGYVNAHGFVNTNSLPPAEKLAQVGGVPFVFPGPNVDGNDHIDVGLSLFREANEKGYLQSGPNPGTRWYGAGQRDPARIQLRLPNGFYDALYLIAASDGEPDSVPLVSAMFYRPAAGFSETFEARVPLATATLSDPASGGTDAKPLSVRLANGRKANLWLVKIPLDPARLTSFADLDIIEVELTKKVHQYRSYPDPISYGWHQGGLPSGVRIYAATLAHAPIVFTWNPDRFGHVWTAPEVASYTGTITNRSNANLTGKLTVTTRSYDGTETTKQESPVTLAAGKSAQAKFSLPVKLNGYHDVVATFELGDHTWTEKRSFVRLAPDTRSVRWTEGKGALFGYWSYHGGHHTPNADRIIELMTAAGARTAVHMPNTNHPLVQKHWDRDQAGAWEVSPQPWAAEQPYDQKKHDEYQRHIIDVFTKKRDSLPENFRPDHVYFYPEPHISLRLTAGNYPTYWGEKEYEYTKEEQDRLRMFFVTSKCASEAIRKTWPNLKVLVPWGEPLFSVPLLRAGFPKNLIDGSGLDICGFERLPEQQLHQISLHRLYILRKEYEQAGIPNPVLQYCEGIFVPTEPGACTWREQMDIYHRWALISMAYGVKRFYSGWFAFDCGNYYGAEHYGGCGIQRRIPYCDPKPAYAAYATMTDKLNEANFDGWLKTGSLTSYCLRFKGPQGNVYALWTIRGKRPVTLTLAADEAVNVTDSMNNTKVVPSKDRKLTITTDPSVVYVTNAGEIVSVEVGEPDNADAQPAPGALQLADLGDGSWSYTSKRDLIYENDNFAIMRYLGQFSEKTVADPQHGKALASMLGKQEKEHELMPWYNTLTPKKPIVLPHACAAIGVWAKGASDWGRVIYILRDAKDERWISIGTKDEWNCDDIHSWSSFNFDGWRYLRFELPGHTGYDNFRKHGTTWWRSDFGDEIVDLPLRLEEILVEQRTHILYVNDVQPVASDTVAFGKMFVEYAAPEDATTEAVRLSKLRMPLPKETPDLPNPIAEMAREGVGAPTRLIKLTPPEHYYDGTRMHVHFKEVAGAKAYHLWVSAHADGRGAVNMVPAGIKNGQLVTGLRPGIKLYYWITYIDQNDKSAKPSPVHEEVTVDNFKEK